MPLTCAQSITLPNSYLEFTRTNGVAPAVAPSGKARFALGTAGNLLLSVNGGAYAAVAAAGSSSLLADGTAAVPALGFASEPTSGPGLYKSATDELSIATAGLQRWKVDAGGHLANAAVTTATYTIDTRTDVDDGISASWRIRNLSNTASASAVIQFASGTGGGTIGHYPAAHTALSASFQDRLVIRSDVDTTGIMLAALSAAQVIEFRVATTGTILSIATGALTLAAGGHFVFSTTGAGTQLGTAANQLVSFHGATAVAQIAGATQTFSTADGTHAARTAGALTMADGAGTNDGTIGAITADASVIAAFQEVVDQINKLRTDHLDTAAFANFAVDGLQSKGLFA